MQYSHNPLFCQLKVSLQATDLRPGGSLFPGTLNEGDDFAQHLPQEVRWQYLQNLFPDPSSQLTYEGGGADWTQATISRGDLIAQSEDWDLVLDK